MKIPRAAVWIIAVTGVLFAGGALCFEISCRHYINFAGKRNQLTCEVVTTDGQPLNHVELVFSGSKGFHVIPIGMGGGQPARVIRQQFIAVTAVPAAVSLEWPRLYLFLEEVRVNGRSLPMHHPRGTVAAQWEGQQPKFFTDGSRDWTENAVGNYSARVELDLEAGVVYVEKTKAKEPNQPLEPTTGLRPAAAHL